MSSIIDLKRAAGKQRVEYKENRALYVTHLRAAVAELALDLARMDRPGEEPPPDEFEGACHNVRSILRDAERAANQAGFARYTLGHINDEIDNEEVEYDRLFERPGALRDHLVGYGAPDGSTPEDMVQALIDDGLLDESDTHNRDRALEVATEVLGC